MGLLRKTRTVKVDDELKKHVAEAIDRLGESHHFYRMLSASKNFLARYADKCKPISSSETIFLFQPRPIPGTIDISILFIVSPDDLEITLCTLDIVYEDELGEN